MDVLNFLYVCVFFAFSSAFNPSDLCSFMDVCKSKRLLRFDFKSNFFLVLFAHRCPLLWIKDCNLNKVFSLVTYGPLHSIMVRRLHCRLFFFRVSLFTAAIVTANLQEKTKSDDGFFPLAQSELNIKSQNEQRNDKFVNKKMERKLTRVYSLEKSPMCNMSSICMRK